MAIFTKKQLEKIIKKEHWKLGKSLRQIERDLGIGKTVVQNSCKRFGILTRSKAESIRSVRAKGFVTNKSGAEHWRKQNIAKSKKLAKKHSKAMKKSNPMFNKVIKEKVLYTRSKIYAKNPTKHEAEFIEILHKHKINFSFQKATICGVADFIFGNVIFELDGRGHASRSAADAIRDKTLNALSMHVVRVNQDSLRDFRRQPRGFWKIGKLFEVLKKYITSTQIPTIKPSPIFGKYRVIVREADTGIERRF